MKTIGTLLSLMAFTVISIALGGLISSSLAADVVVIANKGVDAGGFTDQDIKNIFLGKKTKWANNEKITFIIQKGTDDHKAFLKKYVGRTESQFRSFWKKMVFTGKGKAPKSAGDSSAIIDFVSSTEGAVGYISSGVSADKVKIIAK